MNSELFLQNIYKHVVLNKKEETHLLSFLHEKKIKEKTIPSS